MKKALFGATLLFSALAATTAMADGWKAGIGTGLAALQIDATVGIDAPLVGGAVQTDMKLDPADVYDYMDTAVGFAGYAAKGKWQFLYSYANMTLEGSGVGPEVVAGNGPVSARVSFKAVGAELATVYQFAKTGHHMWGVLGGVRYTSHEVDSVLADNANTLTRNIDNDWTDFLVGLTHNYPLSQKWVWGNRVDFGFGDSDTAVFTKTGVSWHFAKKWMADFSARYYIIDYENGTKGDADWYLYDGTETTVSAGIVYKFL